MRMNSIVLHNFARYVFILVFSIYASACFSKENTIYDRIANQYSGLDKQYVTFSQEFYQQLTADGHYNKINNINTLLSKANRLYKSGNIPDAVALIVHNQQTVLRNINAKAVINIENILLESNEFETANTILDSVKQDSDPSLISNVLFAFTKYYYARNDWQQVVNLVKKIANDLPTDDYQHALFMEGIALQQQHKHRLALAVYKKIPENSMYYTNARLNMAVSDFRQEWWTDAHIIIKDLLKIPKVNKNKELTDRLHTIIGYSFLQLEYFRNSRNAFRNVSLDSSYTNQALIGIALDAAYQKDYIGALNAARILKDKQETDLESDESHLLLPYFYEKLHQNATASAGYTSAIQYYENRLHAIKVASQADLTKFKTSLLTNSAERIRLNGEFIDLNRVFPASFFRQIRLLNSYRKIILGIKNKRLIRNFSILNNAYLKRMQNATQIILKKKSSFLSDYMNQCRYGLARMYDNTAK